MKLILNNISQTNLFEAIDNPVDAQPSRIKEKPESLIATINNCISIPLAKIVKKEEKQFVPAAEEAKEEPKYTLVSKLPQTLIVSGKHKMINVKERMLENIKKMNQTKIDVDKVEIEIKEEPKIEVKEEKQVEEQVEEQVNIYKERRPIEPVSTNFDFERIIKEQEAKAANVIESRKAATESEKQLQKAFMEQNESEKRYQEELARKEELMRKLESIINNRANIFERETSTNENKIKQNNEQIERAQRIIDSNNKKADLLREQNDKMQSLYEAANMRIEAMQNSRNNDDELMRRVA